jgi:hypothetical protein
MSRLNHYLEMADKGPVNIKFRNFNHFVHEVMFGEMLGQKAISLDLSGIKDETKTFNKFIGSNVSEIVDQYNDFFDVPMEKDQISFLLDNIVASLAQQVKLNKNRAVIDNPAIVNADINRQQIH